MGPAPRNLAITGAVLAAIVFGCLYPLEFHSAFSLRRAIAVLELTWRQFDLSDHAILNILLYAPLGFFGVRALTILPPALRVVAVSAAGFLLSTSIELIQVFERSRMATFGDIYANTLGAFAGGLFGLTSIPFAGLMAACWTAGRLYPFVPMLTPAKVLAAIAPLRHISYVSPMELYRYFIGWLAVAVMLEESGARGWSVLLPPIVLVSRLGILNATLSPEEAGGTIAAMLVWALLLCRAPGRIRAGIIAAGFAVWLILQSLAPFHFSAEPRHFGWIPFLSFLNAPSEVAVRSFLEKSFEYGAFAWLLVRSGIPWPVAAGGGTALMIGLRALQVYLPGRSAEITDAILFVLLACVMRLMDADAESNRARQARKREAAHSGSWGYSSRV